MASSTPDDATVSDALDLLKRDHRLVNLLFEDFERAADLQLDPIARRVCKMLKIHAQIEEEIFYPAARAALQEDALIDAAQVEHAQAKDLIARLEASDASSARFRDDMQQLIEAVRAHVAEEEETLFPKLQRSDMNLRGIGVALAERRHMLMDVLGLHGDDEESGTPRRENIEELRSGREGAGKTEG